MNILVVVTEGFPRISSGRPHTRSFVHGEAEADIAPIVQVKTADINFGNLNPVNEGPFIINDKELKQAVLVPVGIPPVRREYALLHPLKSPGKSIFPAVRHSGKN